MPNPLLGSWRLVSMEYRYADGRVRYPYGREAAGYIIYTADGRMSATIMSGGRAPFGTDFGRGEAPDKKATAFETALAYAGRYEFLGDRVLHHVEASLVPDWTGTTLERLADLQGDRLTLSTHPTTQNGRTRTTVIIWERVGAG
jgi:hypothetical protein